MTESDITSPPRRSRARWAVPAVVAVAVAAAFAAPPLLASASDSTLPEVTPEQLVTAMASAHPVPLSGTAVYTARLGLPDLPVAQLTGADPLMLLSGSSTLRVWSDGAQRSRVALLGQTSEYSVVRDGAQAWTYSSADNAAVHYSLSAADQARYDAWAADLQAGVLPDGTRPLPTPEQAAQQVLTGLGASSTVTLADPTTVAGRDAYQLQVTPSTSGTLVDHAVLAVDAQTSTPLRVQVWSTQDTSSPALEVGFTDVTFATPDDAVLTFTAPAGSHVREVVVPLPVKPTASGARHGEPGALPDQVTVTGTGWASIVQLTNVDVAGLLAGDPAAAAALPGAGTTLGSKDAQDLINQFAPTDRSGRRGAPSLDYQTLYQQLTTAVPEGRLLSSALLSVLVTTDGRVLVGAVPADTLRQAA